MLMMRKVDKKDERVKKAKDLSSALGYDVSLCEKALELNRDNPNRAAEWLMIHSETFVRSVTCHEFENMLIQRTTLKHQTGTRRRYA